MANELKTLNDQVAKNQQLEAQARETLSLAASQLAEEKDPSKVLALADKIAAIATALHTQGQVCSDSTGHLIKSNEEVSKAVGTVSVPAKTKQTAGKDK